MATAEPCERWQDAASRQQQVLSRHQAIVLGLGEEGWTWALGRGRFQSVLPGVALTHSGTLTAGQEAWAAVLYAGEGAALGGAAALGAAGLRRLEPAVTDVHVPERREVRRQPAQDIPFPRRAVEPHRTRGLSGLVHPVASPPRVSTARAVLDAAAWARSPREAELWVVAPVQQRLVTVADVRLALAAIPNVRRATLVREVLDDAELGATARSELDLLRLLRRHGLPEPDHMQLLLRARGVRYLDAKWDRQRVVVEVDGAHHRDAVQWDQDTLRANDVVVAYRAAGSMLLRFTTGNLRYAEDSVVRQLRTVLL